MTSSTEIRNMFIDYFRNLDHKIINSSTLIPSNDATLMFTNAGMVQFKDVFTNKDIRPYKRAATIQRCVRAGGKHNDLENVGYTNRHHTFFEMLGNFSFGDYFKRDAIHFAWNFLTKNLDISKNKLWVTVYQTDNIAYEVWKNDICIPSDHIVRVGDKTNSVPYDSDNFWSMGDTGPCGPCSEIFYDYGKSLNQSANSIGDNERFVEIWNLVFMQFERSLDGKLTPLPQPSIDTGMGLERLTAILQGVISNYETDLFNSLIDFTKNLGTVDKIQFNSLRVITDHIRSTSFLITDGILPSNEGRGYVLRRIIRRAIFHGHKMGINCNFFYKLVNPFVELMGAVYPELIIASKKIADVILEEEQRFAETLNYGMHLLEKNIRNSSDMVLSGETAFKLYDTYGFPFELTIDIAKEHGLDVDRESFSRAMALQKQRSRVTSCFRNTDHKNISTVNTSFIGYKKLVVMATVIGIYRDDKPTDTLNMGENGFIILDHTPFYAEAGGQIGDTGCINTDIATFEVTDTQRVGSNNCIIHIGVMKYGCINNNSKVLAKVDNTRRQSISLNHSATHLLQAALRQLLGQHISQKGSLVGPNKLRFDFGPCYEPVNQDILANIDQLVNSQIRSNVIVETKFMETKQAIASGALSFFDEKYEDKVRVLKIGQFSAELCGGTHVNQIGEIGLFKIISESSVSSGIRRIEAITGNTAIDYITALEKRERQIIKIVKSDRLNYPERVSQAIEHSKKIEQELKKLKNILYKNDDYLSKFINHVVDVQTIKVLAIRINDINLEILRYAIDYYRSKLKRAVIVIATIDSSNKVQVIAGITKTETKILKAFELIQYIALQISGKGGGRADLAQAGGGNPSQLEKVLNSVADWVCNKIKDNNVNLNNRY